MRKRRLRIFYKLAGLIAIVSVAIAAGIAVDLSFEGPSVLHEALVAGGLAFALGSVATWFIARKVARRLQDIRDEARCVADEHARLEQLRLEALVAKRTQQLAWRNREQSFVLDNVDQGVFLVDFAGRIVGQRSAAVERLLGSLPADRLLTSYVDRFDREQGAWFGVCWAAVCDGIIPPDLALAQMPRQFVVKGKHLELSYQIVNDRRADRVLVVVSDVTARVQRERAERDQQEIAVLVMGLLADRAGFLELYAELEQRCTAMERNQHSDLAALRRDAHTVKGAAASAGLASIAVACHGLEERLDDHDPATTGVAIARVVERWRELSARIAPFTSSHLDRIEVTEDELADLVSSLRRLPGGHVLARVVESWRDEPIRARLERLAGQIRSLSAALGKGPVEIEVEADHTRIAADRWPEFWGALVHVVRNAVDHGLETPEERVAAGKPREAKIALRASGHDGDLRLEIEDHGRGIDWTRVAESARSAGLPDATHDDLVNALFANGLTTRSMVTATSGRGVGLAAVHQACRDAGGDVRVDSRTGLGTCFTFMLPAHPRAPLSALRAGGDRR